MSLDFLRLSLKDWMGYLLQIEQLSVHATAMKNISKRDAEEARKYITSTMDGTILTKYGEMISYHVAYTSDIVFLLRKILENQHTATS